MEETVRVEVPAAVMLAGLTEAVRAEGADVVSETVPAKPLSPVTVIVEVPGEPARMLREEGLAEIVKSTTFTVTMTEWNMELVLPVMVTV